jgi:hypothetical protein
MRLPSSILLPVLLIVVLCGGQTREGPLTIPIPNSTDIPRDSPARAPVRRIDPAQVRNQADELAKLATGIPSDIDQVGKGLLPKELNQKLKRIEKLSKQLRQELIEQH